jgi:type III secretion protein T
MNASMKAFAELAPLWLNVQAWISAWPRALGFFAMLPWFARETLPGLLRIGVVGALCLPLIPVLKTHGLDIDGALLWPQIVKEVVVGFAMGLPVALTFWLMEGVGALLDNQSGSSVASVINPASGNEVAILATLLQQIFMLFFLLGSGFTWLAGALYDSFRLWPIDSWWPRFPAVGAGWWLDQFDWYMRLLMTLAAPVLIAVFLVDLCFGIVGRFAPKMQIFVLAMPLKGIAAAIMLIAGMTVLFGQFDGLADYLKSVVPFALEAIR